MATIDGTSGNDTLNGTSGDDTLTGFAGDDTLNGGDGADKAVFSGAAADYLILHDALTGTFTVVDKEPSVDGDDGTDVVTDIETLEFSDVSLDLTGGSLPLATADAVAVDEDGTLTDILPGSGGIDGPDGGTEVNLSYALVDANGDAVSQLTTAHGVVTITNAATGAYTFEPAENYHGPDSFTFRVTDERGISSEAVVDVTVNSVNDDPIVSGPLEGPPVDPHAGDVVLLMHMEGSNGGTTFTDASGHVGSFSVTGAAQTTTANAQFGSASLHTDSSSHVATATDSSLWHFDGDYTIEGWFYADGALTDHNDALFSLVDSSGYGIVYTLASRAGGGFGLAAYEYPENWGSEYNAVPAVPLDEWMHVAVVRDGSTNRIFLNGDLYYEYQRTPKDITADHLEIGNWTFNSERNWQGEIDEIRVTKGVARYTSDFTVPSEPFPAASDTQSPFETSEDTAFTVTEAELLANASDVDGGTLSIDASTLAFAGGVIVQTSTDPDPRVWQVTPAADANGVIQLTYDIIDGQGGRTATYAEVEVTAVNDTPEVDQGIANQNVDEESAFNFQVPSDAFSDVDDVSLTLTATLDDDSPLPEWLSFDGTTFTGTPDDPDVGTVTVKVTATDALGATAQETFGLTVNSVNDDPIVSGPLAATPVDPHADDVVFLANFDGAAATDLSGRHTMTTEAGNQFSSNDPFGGDSLSGNAKTTAASSDFAFGGDFTVELWLNPTTISGFGIILDTTTTPSGGDTNGWWLDLNGDTLRIWRNEDGVNTVADEIITGTLPSSAVDNWNHVAITREGSTMRMFLDGEVVGTSTYAGNIPAINPLSIGQHNDGSWDFPGLVDEVRITQNVARYTSSFTVPSEPFPAPSDTQSPFETSEDTAFTVTEAELLANASDVDGGTLSIDASTLAFAGGVIVQTSTDPDPRVWQVTPAADANGVIQLTYDIIDGQGGRTATYAEVEVTAVNDTPEVDQGIANQNVDEESAFNFQVPSDAFSDVDDVSLTLTATLDDDSPLPEWLSFDGTTFTGTPDDPDVGTVTVKVTATDALGATAQETFGLTVNSVNDDPIVSGPLAATPVDPHADDVVFLANFDGAAATDLSGRHTMTTEAGNQFSSNDPFGGDSLSGNAKTTAASSDFAFGGDFTVELWLNPTTISGFGIILDTTTTPSGGDTNGWWLDLNGDTLRIWRNEDGVNTVADEIITGTLPSSAVDNWNHVAITREGSTMRMFLDGEVVGTSTYAGNIPAINPLSIGQHNDGSWDFPGLVDEVRITQNVARYTSSFTVPSEPFPAPSDTQSPFATSEQTSVVLSSTALLANASDADDETLGIVNLSSANATITDNGDGTFTVTPDAGFTGTLTLTYDVVDGNGGSASTYAEVLVTAAGAGADEITGTEYGDTIFGGAGDDTLAGGDGDDVLIGGGDDDTLDGGADDDRLFGQDDDDVLTGGAGDDLLDGGDGADTLTGGADNDHLTGGGGDDDLSGGDGDDVLEGDICHADPAGGSKSASGLTVAAWQAAGVYLSARGLDGNPAALTFANEGGYTKVGVDGGTQSEGQINHEEAGGTETLIVDFAATVTSATVTFTNLFSDEDGGERGLWRAYDAVGNLVGEDTFGPADVTTANNVGTLSITGIGAFDRLEFTAIPTVNEEAASDTEPGDSSDYFIAQVDYVAVPYTAGNDTLDGGAGDDMLCAGHGDDDLIGGLGQDVMEGGAGADVFIYQSVADSGIGALLRDVINDFDAGTGSTAVDTIDISAIVSGTFDFLGAESETFNGNGDTEARFNNATKILEIDADGDTQVDMEIELKDVDIANLDDGDFTVA
jgi:Ca2+-binding RTX toxin-like protein